MREAAVTAAVAHVEAATQIDQPPQPAAQDHIYDEMKRELENARFLIQVYVCVCVYLCAYVSVYAYVLMCANRDWWLASSILALPPQSLKRTRQQNTLRCFS